MKNKMNVKNYWEEYSKKTSIQGKEWLFKNYGVIRYIENLYKYVKNGERILDIGCGNAKYFLKLENKFKEFFGVELSNVHFKAAKKIFPKGKYIVADANKLPFPENYFDTIISFGAFEHNNDIDAIFKECYRTLNKNGTLLFSVPNYVSTLFPYTYIHNCLMKRSNRIIAIGHYYTKRELSTKLQKVGFEDIKIVDSIAAAPIPFIGLVAMFIKRIGLINSYNYNSSIEEGNECVDSKGYNKLKESHYYLDYFFNKLFYPLERTGFGFMRVIYCKKQVTNGKRID